MTHRQSSPCQSNYLLCDAGQQIWSPGLVIREMGIWYALKLGKLCQKCSRSCPHRNAGLGPLLELNLNQAFWKGLFILPWDDDTKYWDTTRELVLMEISILHLGSSLKDAQLCTFWVFSKNQQEK